MDELLVPDASSDLGEFKHQFQFGLFSDDEAHASKVSKAYLETLGPKDVDAVGEWKSFCELFKLEYTHYGDLHKLAALGNEYENNPSVHERVAQGYLLFDDFNKAQAHFRTAIESSDDRKQKIGLLGEMACANQKYGSREDLFKAIAEMRDLIDGPETEDILLAKLVDISDWYHDDVLKAAMLERELSIDPTDTSKRFQLAYLHSQEGDEALAMFHYEKIPANNRDELAWNNLGVTYRHFRLKGKSIDAYRRATKGDETLAMSNLAYEFMGAGFLSEADEILKEAQKQPNYHASVASALVRLREIPEEESKTHEDKLKGVSSKSDFLSHVGKHLWQRAPDKFFKTMSDPDCELNVTSEGENFLATGAFQKTQAAFASAFTGNSNPPKTENYIVEYRGRIVGQVIIGERTKKKQGPISAASSLLGIDAYTQKFIIVVPVGAQKLRGMIGTDLIDFELSD